MIRNNQSPLGAFGTMVDFNHARENMVDCQVRTSDVTEHALISAMLTVQREEFVPADMMLLAYIDDDISLDAIGSKGRHLMQAASFAKLAQLADVKNEDIVLIVGAGSGYSSAVFSLMASSVVAIEEDEALVEFASQKLSDLDYSNVAVLNKPLTAGYPKEAPYDVIFFEGSVEIMPESFFEQLAEGGRLVCAEGTGNAAFANLYLKKDGIVSGKKMMNCSVSLLPGFERKQEFTF